MRNLNVAVCKPDHLGDFVLALPALRQLQRSGAQLTLFIAPANFGLARHHCPDAELVPLEMPNLRRNPAPLAWSDVYAQLGRLRTFDIVLFLRRDAFFHPENFARWTDRAFFIEDRNDRHQTQLERAVISEIFGSYDIDSAFFEGRDMRFPIEPQTVVFAVGAGFPHKKWSPLLWIELGQILQSRGIAIRILSGPNEAAESKIIARGLGLDVDRNVFVGGRDFKALEDWLDESDVVVAVDGGSAHLCSLRKPVLGIFGPSPIARYAPIGRNNRMITRSLACSPCVGFDQRTVNACTSRECMYGLRPASVFEALRLPTYLPGQTVAMGGVNGAQVWFGLSGIAA